MTARALVPLVLLLAVAGCASPISQSRTTPILGRTSAPASAPTTAPATAPASSPTERNLQPGRVYVASFSEAERREVCLALNYEEGTRAYARCLEGYFPENPAYRGGN